MKTRTVKISLDGYGSFLGRHQGNLIIRNKEGKVKKYPLFESEIAEIQIKSGNYVSSGALATCAFWGIDFLVLTQRGNPVAVLKSLVDDSHVNTRIAQYEALKNEKGVEIARQLVLSKFEGQNVVLGKYGLRRHNSSVVESIKNLKVETLSEFRTRLMCIEGHFSRKYFDQILGLVPTSVRPPRRRNFKAYDGINNVFNLAYEILSWKIQYALMKAKLEPYLGFLHSTAKGKPSLICDFQELYRCLVDDFVIQFCHHIGKKDFIMKTEDFSARKKGKRQYLNDSLTRSLTKSLNEYFQSEVEIPRIRTGKKQEIETLISEEALLFAKYLRGERQSWVPRTPC